MTTLRVPFKGREVELEIGKGINIFYGMNGVGKSLLIKESMKALKEAGIIKVLAHMKGDVIVFDNGLTFNIHDMETWMRLTAEPFTFIVDEQLRDDIYWLLGVRYLRGGYALKGDEWIPVEFLSYGERKVLALMLTLKMADMVVVEGFEGGLHFNLAVDLLRKMEDYEKYVIIETHMGILIKAGLQRGWNIYYVSKDGVTKLTKENLLDSGLFKEEAEAYSNVFTPPY
jgi:predicted ATPase